MQRPEALQGARTLRALLSNRCADLRRLALNAMRGAGSKALHNIAVHTLPITSYRRDHALHAPCAHLEKSPLDGRSAMFASEATYSNHTLASIAAVVA